MNDLNFAYVMLNQVKTSLHCNLGGKTVVDKMGSMLGVDNEIIQEIASMPISHQLLNEAAYGLPEPQKSPILCDSNRNQFFQNLVSLSHTI
ncbi:hypothetical protein [Photobacterium damselae]|uniref:hypothetical protein n=1 Tax=Photobacterium damselae TaxID=38293 RepID=UPI00406811B9